MPANNSLSPFTEEPPGLETSSRARRRGIYFHPGRDHKSAVKRGADLPIASRHFTGGAPR